MVGLPPEQRQLLRDKVPDAANLLVGALWFGQFMSDREFSWGLAACGIGGWLGLMAVSVWLGGGKRKWRTTNCS